MKYALAAALLIGFGAGLVAQQGLIPTNRTTVQWGLLDDIPVTGNFDTTHREELGVFRPSTGEWFLLFSVPRGAPPVFRRIQWGLPGDVPMPSDQDGDTITDLVVYRPDTGTWYVKLSNGVSWRE